MRSLRTLLVIAGTFAALTVLAPTASASHGRTFHLVKVCDAAGCTVTESNYPQISEDTRITYEGTGPDALVATVHAEHGIAVGNCDISAVFAGTGPGTCVFQGGTGSLTPFRVTLAVTRHGADWFWDGEFHHGP
jgi:hypothetical protein